MANQLEVAIILRAVDKATQVINAMTGDAIKKLNDVHKRSEEISKKSMKFGKETGELALAGAAFLAEPIKAFAEMQEASDQLNATLMMSGGRENEFADKISDLAQKLGTSLPGTTADFQKMFTALIKGGVSAESIVNGVGSATADLATVIHLPYDMVAESTARLKMATGVADKDFIKFMDTIQRASNESVKVDDLEMAFARSAGALKNLKLQGLDASKDLTTLFSIMIRNGDSAEKVGTGMGKMFGNIFEEKKRLAFEASAAALGIGDVKFLDKVGNFKGIDNMMMIFDRIKEANLSEQAQTNLMSGLFGTGEDAKIALTLVNSGVEGFNKLNREMKNQGSLEDRRKEMLKGVAAQWHNTWGNIVITMAKFGEILAPTLQKIMNKLNQVAAAVSKFMKDHPTLAKNLGMLVIGFIAVTASLSAMGFVFGGVARGIGLFSQVAGMALTPMKFLFSGLSTGMSVFMRTGSIVKGLTAITRVFNLTLLANPIVLIAAAIIAAAVLIFVYWDKIKQFFITMWDKVKIMWGKFMDWFKSWGKYVMLIFTPFLAIPLLIVAYWDKIKAFFIQLWENIKKAFVNFFLFLKKIFWDYHPYVLIYKNWDKIVAFFKDLWEKVKGVFMHFFIYLGGIGARFFDAGKNMVKSIWEGIKSFAHKPIDAIKGMVSKIRNLLPFSPAKDGPLKDIHRIRLVETIADSIKPDSLVKAMKVTAASAMIAFSPMNMAAAVKGPTIASSGSADAGSNKSGGGVILHYSPTITINGGSATAKEDFAKMLKEHSADLMKLMNEELRKRERSAY